MATSQRHLILAILKCLFACLLILFGLLRLAGDLLLAPLNPKDAPFHQALGRALAIALPLIFGTILLKRVKFPLDQPPVNPPAPNPDDKSEST